MKSHGLHILSFILAVCLSAPAYAQHDEPHPLSDALDYHKWIKAAENTTDSATYLSNLWKAKTIADKYDTNSLKRKGLDSLLFSLIYRSDMIDTLKQADDPQLDGEQHSSESVSLGASEMIDVLSKLIAERFREELTIAFLDRFRIKLKSDTLLSDVFPNTRRVLLYDDPFKYDAWLTSFRGAMHLDLSTIPQHIPDILEGIVNSADDTAFVKLKKELKPLVHDLFLLRDFIEHPEKSYANVTGLLNQMASGKSSLVMDAATKTWIGQGQHLVRELSTPDYKNWASNEELDELFKDPKKLKTFIAFFLYKHRDVLSVTGSEGSSFLTQLSGQAEGNNMAFLKQIMNDVRAIIKQINAIQEQLQNPQAENPVGQYLTLTTQTFALVGDLLGHSEKNAKVCAQWKKVEVALESIVELQESVSQENYAAIIPGLLSTLEALVDPKILERSVFLKEVLKYGNLAVTLTSAKTSEEFAQALESSILPTQSYRLKRNALFSISVNAYAGGFLAQERLLDPAVKTIKSGLAGFTAPIGLGFNWGITVRKPTKFSHTPVVTKYGCRKNKSQVMNGRYYSGHSISLFASVIDIGAVVAFRIQDTVAPSAQVQWKNIIAPGAYVVWGIGRTPLSLQFGVQYGPELRKVEILDGVSEITLNSRAWRIGGALTVDIPLYNIYSKTERVAKEIRELP